MKTLGPLLALWCILALVVPAPTVALANQQGIASQPQGEISASAEPTSFGTKLKRALWIFLLLSIVALVLLIGTVIFLFWHAKQLVENAVKPDLPALEKLVAAKRDKYPDLMPKDLARKLIHRQATRAGLVGFVTGLGGLPTLPIAIPIDLAMTIKIQSNLVHMLRLATGRQVGAEDVSEASLWLITTGGQELATASGTMIRRLVVGMMSKSLLKFVPLVGGLVGFALNWASTQTLGRLTLVWLEGQGGKVPRLRPTAL